MLKKGGTVAPVDTSYINVKSAPYLAQGDGVTNDRAAIKKAMDSAFAKGKSLYFPAGTYAVSQVADIGEADITLRPGVRVFGDGNTSIIKRSGNINGGIMNFDPANLYADSTKNNYRVDHLKLIGALDGRRSGIVPGVGSKDYGLIIQSAAHTRIWSAYFDHVTVQGTNKEAIAIWNCDSAVITNCNVINTNFDAYNPAWVRRLILTNNACDSATFAMEYVGEQVYAVGDTVTQALIANNSFTNCFEYGINVGGGDTVRVNNNYIHGYDTTANLFQAGYGVGLKQSLTGETGSPVPISLLALSGNRINGFVHASIGMIGDILSDNATCKTFTSTGDTLENAGQNAIYLTAYDSTKIGFFGVANDTIRNWNRRAVASSYDLSAIGLDRYDSVSITGSRFYNNLNTNRNDPLYMDKGKKLVFKNNNLSGPKSASNGMTLLLKRTLSAGIDTTDGNLFLDSLHFYPVQHTITASSGPNGTISPTGSVIVFDGENQVFSLTGSTNYAPDSLTVDGVKVAPASSYTFTNVTANHTIVAAFTNVIASIASPTVPAPTFGAELLTNGNMETGNPPSTWAVNGAGTKYRKTDPKTGTYCLALRLTGGSGVYNTFTTAAGNWYNVNGWVKMITSTYIQFTAYDWGGAYLQRGQAGESTAGWMYMWNTFPAVEVATAIEVQPSGNDSTHIDDVSAKRINIVSMMSNLTSGLRDTITTKVNVTIATASDWLNHMSPAGLVVSYVDTANFIIVYYSEKPDDHRIVVDKYVAGVKTQVSTTSVTYAAAGTLQVARQGTNYIVSYRGSTVGSPNSIADAVFNTAYQSGIFNTYLGNTFANFYVGP
jgi:hypothetical protein